MTLSYVQTPEGWFWIDILLPIPPASEMKLLRDDVAAIKSKLGIV